MRSCLRRVGTRPLFIEPGSPWDNDYVGSFDRELRVELLDREICYTRLEAQVLIEDGRTTYNAIRPHSSLGYRPLAPDTIRPASVGLTSPATTATPKEALIAGLT